MSDRTERICKRILKHISWIVFIALIFIVAAVVAFKIYTANYYRADHKIISAMENLLDNEVNYYADDDGAVFIPEQEAIKAVIVFYPGGKVEYNSYYSLMYELTSHGYLCLLPKMPENLALLNVNAVEGLLEGYEEYYEIADVDWYLAGHSLGGVAAATYLYRTLDESSDGSGTETSNYRGLILCASYPTSDFSNTDLRLLSIYGSEDRVLNMDKYKVSKSLWPEDSTEYIIDGGIHSYFGSYGIQSGDGDPAITNETQIKITADVISEWIDSAAGR